MDGTGYFARNFSHTRKMFMTLTPDVTTAEEDSTSTIKELNRMYDFFFLIFQLSLFKVSRAGERTLNLFSFISYQGILNGAVSLYS